MSEEKGTFKKMEATDQRMFGPRALLLSGFDEAERGHVELMLLASIADLPLIWVNSLVGGQTLLKLSEGGCLAEEPGSDLPRAVVFSGVTERELHEIMALYKKLELPRPLWAALTETSQHWPFRELVRELESERAALDRR